MKSSIADYKTRIFAARIVARNGSVVRIVAHPTDLEMGGNTYKTDSGYQFSSYSSPSNSASSIDIEGFLVYGGIDRDDLASGAWDGSRFYLFATSWTNPIEDEEPIAQFIFGKARLRDDRYTAEVMHLIDVIDQEVSRTVTPECQWDFCSEECGLDISDFTFTGTITAVSDASTFTDSSRAEGDDYFVDGTVEFNSGNNSNVDPIEIYAFSAGQITTYLPFHYVPDVGDSYTIRRGCPKTRDGCKERGNIENMGGFPDLPTNSTVNKIGGL